MNILRRKEYLKKYQREWMRQRRAAFFDGKSCAKCGAMGPLELDHIDPLTKIDHKIWSWRKARRDEEIEKCQILCEECHKAKTHPGYSGIKHGTNLGYTHYKCRCELCILAHRAAFKEWYERRGRKQRMEKKIPS